MKKQIIYTIIGIALIAVAITGSTYAYLSSTINSRDDVNANSSNLNIVYSGSGSFNETISIVSNRNEGSSTTISMYTANNSVSPLINLYINIESMTDNLAVEGFIWEVCAIRENEPTVCNDGNFFGYDATTNNVVTIMSNYRLTTVPTTFIIYLWLDGSKISGTLDNAQFSGYIDARSENFRAKFNQQ